MLPGSDLLQALPVAVYATDAEGRITFYNEAAAELWGHRPELGTDQWCGSWRLYWPDGRPMPHDECPMAVTLKERREVRGAEAIAERPDGTRICFAPYPSLLRDKKGRVTGAINLLIDLTDRKRGELERARLAAIVNSSDDAIVSKTLDGVITSWNAGAARIFGYSAEEMIGEPIIRIIPPELRHEETDILTRLRRGERIEHYDTVRVAKDGRRINISLTVSPLHDSAGNVVGASKVARDITERKQSQELQELLFEELNHRVKNTLATIQAIAGQSLRRAKNPDDFVSSFNGRVQALSRAHDLLVEGKLKGAAIADIVREQVLLGITPDERIASSGPVVVLDARTAVQLALVLHELATNARKYGALSVRSGRLSIVWSIEESPRRELHLKWKESGVPKVRAPTSHGFGTTLIERTLEANGGEAAIRYDDGGVSCTIRLAIPEDAHLAGSGESANARMPDTASRTQDEKRHSLHGKRILIVEDEALIAMDMEAELRSAGCEVVGPAATVAVAKRLIAETRCDAALVDANLADRPADEVAAALTEKAIPFAFATGHGRPGLPEAFRDRPLLGKPSSRQQLLAMVESLLAERPVGESNVIPLRADDRGSRLRAGETQHGRK